MTTKRQIAALKYLISAAKDGNPRVKQIMYFLIDRSERLTKEVCVTLTQDCEGFTGNEIDRDARKMSSLASRNCSTHIDQIMIALGTKFRFCVHYGNFGNDGKFDTSGMFPGMSKNLVLDEKLTILNAPMRYTYWLASDYYSKTAKTIPVTRAELDAIDISKPGLYPDIENQSLAV